MTAMHAVDRRRMLGCLAGAPLIGAIGTRAADLSALLQAALMRRLPGVDLDAVLSAAVAADWQDPAAALVKRLSTSADPLAILAALERNVPGEPIVRAGGWYLAQSDVLLLAARRLAKPATDS